MSFVVPPEGRSQGLSLLPRTQLQFRRVRCLRPSVSSTRGWQYDLSVCLQLREENLELRKLLMSSSKDGASGRPGSPKMEGAGKKGAATLQQVCGQKLLPQIRMASAQPPGQGASPTAGRLQLLDSISLAFSDSPPPWSFHFSAHILLPATGSVPFPRTHT